MRKSFFAVILAVAILLPVALVAAQEAPLESPPEVPLEWIHTIWAAAKATPIAILTALVTCLAGCLSKTPQEKFDLKSFVYTVLISLAIGYLTVIGGWTYAEVQQWFANGFLTWYIWKVAKIIAKKFSWTTQTLPTTGPGPPTTA